MQSLMINRKCDVIGVVQPRWLIQSTISWSNKKWSHWGCPTSLTNQINQLNFTKTTSKAISDWWKQSQHLEAVAKRIICLFTWNPSFYRRILGILVLLPIQTLHLYSDVTTILMFVIQWSNNPCFTNVTLTEICNANRTNWEKPFLYKHS